MTTPFLVRVHSADMRRAEEIAAAIRAGLTLAGAQASVDCAPGASADVHVSPGVWGDAGAPRWLEPIPVPDEPVEAATTIVDFLERWGFMARAARA